MRAGVIGLVDGVGRFESARYEREVDGWELVDSVRVDGVSGTPDGHHVTRGRAATQSVETTEHVDVAGDDIVVEDREDVVTDHARFLGVDDEFVVVPGGRNRFVFDLLARQGGVGIERATVELGGVLDALPDPAVWKAGFADGADTAESGVLYGDDVLGDDALASLVDDATLNQLGVTFTHAGDDVKASVTASGYVDVHQPNSYDDADFAAFVSRFVLPHTH